MNMLILNFILKSFKPHNHNFNATAYFFMFF